MKSFGIVSRLKTQLLGAGCVLVLTAAAANARPGAVIIGNSAGFAPSQPLIGRPYFPNQGNLPNVGIGVYPSYGAPGFGSPIYGIPIYGVPARNRGGNSVVIVGDNTKVYVDNRGANMAYPYGYPTAGYPNYAFPGYGGYAGYPGPGFGSGYGSGYGDNYGALDYGAQSYGGTTSSVYGQFSIGGGDTRLTIGAGQQQTSTYAR